MEGLNNNIKGGREMENIREALEDLLDANSLDDILELLSDICHDKAEHVSSMWQDDNLSKCWIKNAEIINKMREKIIPTF